MWKRLGRSGEQSLKRRRTADAEELDVQSTCNSKTKKVPGRSL